MWIKMNYTNFTTDKPAVYEIPSASTFGSVRDIAYLVFSILQFCITVFGLVWVNYIIRKKDKKDADKRLEKDRRHKEAKEERLEKAERDKIADIITDGYNKIVEDGIDENLRKCKEKFEAMVMFYGDAWETRGRKYKITGLDVLRFMLRNPNDFKGEPLKKLQEDLDAVVRLFRTLRIKLPLKGDCPIHIKEDLGPLITDVAEIARSFVSAKKRYTIANVLKYFGNVLEGVNSIETEKEEDDDDNGEIRRICPYINGLSLGESKDESTSYNDQDFSFDIFTAPGDQKKNDIIAGLAFFRECKLCKKEPKTEDLRPFADEIDAIWGRKFPELPMPDWSKEEHLCANILHAVHVFLFKVVEGSDIIHDKKFKELVDETRNAITYGLIADNTKLCGLSDFCEMESKFRDLFELWPHPDPPEYDPDYE